MNILIKNAVILDADTQWHNKKANIHIVDGVIKAIGDTAGDSGSQIIEGEDIYVSPGWFDIGASLTDPGNEHLDTVQTLSASAAKGGFTGLAVFPRTKPKADNKSVIISILDKAHGEAVDIYPVGNITVDANGKDLAEMIDMYKHGAVAFSDGCQPLAHAGVMSRALLYTAGMPTYIINRPEDMSITESGIVNEGKISVMLGVKGRPALAEMIMLMRDIYLCDYNNSKMITHTISTAGAVKLVKEAKRKKINVKATVSFHNLVENEEALKDFDAGHKVLPPLRTRQDVNALIRGLKDGTIDAIVSNHRQVDIEDKRKAFFDAEYGAISLEYMFALLNTKLASKLPLDLIIEKISNKPREILGLPTVHIEEGKNANITVFSPSQEWNFTEKDIKSKSKNTPYINTTLKGKVLAVINNGKMI